MAWQYLQQFLAVEDGLDARLSELGKHGWEMVNFHTGQAPVSRLEPDRYKPVLFCLFKRPAAACTPDLPSVTATSDSTPPSGLMH